MKLLALNNKKIKKLIALTLAVCLAYNQLAYALPQDVTVEAGQATVNVDGSTMTINASSGTILNSSSFDIAQNEAVIINLPNASSDILSRVTGPNPTTWAGNLSCNGLLIFINTNGIYITPTANINVGSIVLSTRDITNADFLNHNYAFQKISQQQLDVILKNSGTINVSNGGFGVLIAGAIENEGKIIAPCGRIHLATGDAIKLDISAGGLISVAIDEDVASTVKDFEGNPITDQIKNTGELDASGGMVVLDANSVTDVFTKAVNLEGTIRADDITVKADGTVTLGLGTVPEGDCPPSPALIANHTLIDAPRFELIGDKDQYFYGDMEMHNFNVAQAGKHIYFEPGKTYTFKDSVYINGQNSAAGLVRLLSQESGSAWKIDMNTTDYSISHVGVADSYNIRPELIYAKPKCDLGGNTGWAHNNSIYWTGTGNWSVSGNWTGGVPTAADDVYFNDAGAGASTINTFGTNTIKSLTINGYTNTITQSANLAITGAYAQSTGKFVCSDPTTYSFTVGGSFSVPENGGATSYFNRYTTDGGYYVIRDIYDLQAMDCVLTANYKLNNDINASATRYWNSNGSGGYYGFEPIGYGTGDYWYNYVGLQGNFYGQNHTISNLYINRPSTISVGLIGGVSGATNNQIKDLGLLNVDITGGNHTGALAGGLIYMGEGAGPHITNCYSTGTVTGADSVGGLIGRAIQCKITNSYSTATVSGTGRVGGFMGSEQGWASWDLVYLTNCYSTGNVNAGGGTYAGGFVGEFHRGTISGCYSTGNVTNVGNYGGGFVGHNKYATMSNCYSSGNVTGADSGDRYMGGFIGYKSQTSYTTTNCYSSGVVTGGTNRGGFIGVNTGTTFTSCLWDSTVNPGLTDSAAGDVSGITGKTTAEMMNYTTFNGAGWSISNTTGSTWGIQGTGQTGAYPMLQMRYSTTITDAYQLQLMYLNLGATYTLANNIDASATSTWNAGKGFEPVGESEDPYSPLRFTGSLDGQGHTITGLFIYRPDENFVGLLGATYRAGAQNLGMINANITGYDNVGGIIGNCFNYPGAYEERISMCYSTGTITGHDNVGGLMGGSYDTSVGDSWSSANVTGNIYVGGINGGVGFGRTRRCYSTGTITGTDYVGGISGNQTGVPWGEWAIYNFLTNSFSTATINSSGTHVGGLAGNLENDYCALGSYYTDGNHQNGFGTYEPGGAAAFYNSSHSVYNTTNPPLHPEYGVVPWNFTTTWESFSDALPHLQWEGITPTTVAGSVSDIADGEKIAIAVNGGNYGWTTVSGGNYSLSLYNAPAANNAVLIWADNGGTDKANLVTSATGANMSGLTLTDGRISLRNDSGSGMTNDILYDAHYTDSDVHYSVSAETGGTAAFSDGIGVWIPAGHTYAPGGNIEASGNWTNAGNFTCGSGSVNFNGTSAQQITAGGSNFNDIDISATGVRTITFLDNVVINDLDTASQGYSVAFNEDATVTTDTTFLNTGSVTLGNGSDDALTFTGGLDTQACAGGTSMAGTVATANTQIDLGAVTLNSDSAVKSGSGAINFKSTITDGAGSYSLDLHENTAGSTGTVTFTGNVTIDDLDTFSRDYSVVFNGSSNTITTNTVFSNTGLLVLGDNGDTFNFNGGMATTGMTNMYASINTTDDIVWFQGAVNLNGNSTINTVGSSGNTITFASTLYGTTSYGQTLGLTAGTGNIDFNNQIGTATNKELGAMTINSANTSTFDGAVTTADLITTSNCGSIALNNGGLFVQKVDFLNTGTVTLGSGGGDTFNFNGGLATSGNATNPSSTNIYAAINTSDDAVTLGATTLTGNSSINTVGTTGATVTFANTLDGSTSYGQTLGLTAGTGNIDFDATVGYGTSKELGAITINSAADVTADSTIESASLVQTTGTGTTTLKDNVTTSAATGVDITAANIYLDGLTIDTSSGNGVVRMAGPTRLDDAAIITRGSGAVTFTNTLYSQANEANTLTFNGAGGGDIAFTGAVGSGVNQALGTISINTAANNVTMYSTLAASSLSLNATATELRDNVTLTGSFTNNAGTATIKDDVAVHTLQAGGDFNIAGGSVKANDNTIKVGGDWKNDVGVAGFIEDTSTVQFIDDADHSSTITGSTEFNVLKCATTDNAKTLKFTTAADQKVNYLDIDGQKGKLVYMQSTSDLGVQAGINVVDSSVLYASIKDINNTNAAQDVTPDKSINRGNNTNFTFEALQWDAGGGVNKNWSNTDNWETGVIPTQYDNVALNVAAETDIDSLRAAYCNNITIGAGSTLDLNGYNFTVTGGLENLGIVNNTGGANITITADNIRGGHFANAGNLSLVTTGADGDIGNTVSPITIDQANRVNATVNGTGELYLIADAIDFNNVTTGTGSARIDADANIYGAFDMNATLDVNGSVDIKAGGTLDANGNDINVSKNWTRAGTFTSGDNNVIFDTTNDSTITGNTDFHDFTCVTGGKTLYFTAGSTQNMAGMTTLTGAAGNLLKIRSTTTGTKANINPAGGVNISYVDVRDSNNMNGTIINPANSVGQEPLWNSNQYNNTNWFPTPAKPYEPPEPPPSVIETNVPTLGIPNMPDAISVGFDFVNTSGKSKYDKTYGAGKYKTTVIVMEGAVAVADYGQMGANYADASMLTGGQSLSRTGEIK